MKQKLLNSFKLRALMLVAILCAGFTSAWGADEVAYTLAPASGSNNSYTGNCDITINDITWNLSGNSQQIPWRIGGKSLSGVDRTLYSKTAITDNISKIEVTHGAASSITVNSWTVIVASDADFNNVVSTLTPTFAANSTTTITRPEGKDWSNCYYKFVYNVTVSGTSNKFLEFSNAKFYKESGSSDPIQLDAPELAATANNGSVTLEWDEISNASSYTIQYADNASFTGATTLTDATSPKEISGLTNGTTYYFKAMTVGDGTNYLSSDYGVTVSATPANVSKITITQDNLTDFTNAYDWYDWTAGGVSGSAFAYKNGGMQFNSSKDGYWIYNTTAIPGTITSVKMVKASGTDRSWTLKVGTSEIASTNDGEQIRDAQTVGTRGATWNVNGSYNYFCLIVSGGSTVIQSIEITYIPSTDPIIVASNPSELAYDATGGEFEYSITNPTSATLSATSDAAWITNVTVDGTNSKVTFNTTANEATTQRQGTITLSYTGATDKVITVTQAECVVELTYNLASSITSGKHYIITSGDDNAMGTQNSNNRAAVGVTNNNNSKVTFNSNAGVTEFVIYGPDADDLYTIYDASEKGYLYAASSGSNHLKTQAGIDDNARWEITFDDEDVASIVAVNSENRNVMQYNSGSTLFSCYGSASQSAVYLYEKDGEATPTESKTLNDNGYATYASQNALDFTNNSEVSAWAITAVNSESGVITFSQITGQAPAGTGMLLKGTANGSVTMTSATGAIALTGNLLEGTTADKEITDNQYFGLKGKEFVPVNAGTVPAGKALLPASEVPAEIKAFTFVFETVDGIKTVEHVSAEEAAEIFNLAGQRLKKAQRGVNIINGKKVLVK